MGIHSKNKMASKMTSLSALKNFHTGIQVCRRSFGHAKGPEGLKSLKRWKLAFLFGGLPAVGFLFYNAFALEDHHKPRDEFVPYPHLRIRNKAFPWGDGNKSLFHNPYYNALPEGYEEGSEELNHH